MSLAAEFEKKIVRCGSCGSLLFTDHSLCLTCHAIATRNEGKDWTERALCREIDPELWFPESEGVVSKHVKEICAKCPVKRNCLRVGLHEGYGIWGGYSAPQRSELRRRVVGLKPSARDAIVNQAADQGSSFLDRAK